MGFIRQNSQFVIKSVLTYKQIDADNFVDEMIDVWFYTFFKMKNHYRKQSYHNHTVRKE